MGTLIAICGLDCGACPAYLATQNNDGAAKEKIARDWAREFGMEIKPEAINCDGCTTAGGRRIGYCRICAIRNCGTAKGLRNCAECEDYACEKLSPVFVKAAQAKVNLDEIRKQVKP